MFGQKLYSGDMQLVFKSSMSGKQCTWIFDVVVVSNSNEERQMNLNLSSPIFVDHFVVVSLMSPVCRLKSTIRVTVENDRRFFLNTST